MENPWVGGGGAVRVYETNRRLVPRGHEVTVLSGNFPGATDSIKDGISYKFLGSPKNYPASTFTFSVKAALFIRKYGDAFDIVVEDFAPWNPVFSRFMTRRPAVLHVNHREGPGILKRLLLPGIPFYLLESFYPKFFRNVTALSEWTARKTHRFPGAEIVPAGVDFEGIQARLSGAPRGDYIAYVGRLHIKNKGLDTLFSALRKIPGAKLVIGGRGPDEEALRQMARNLGLQNVQFLGFLSEDEKIRLLEGAALFVLPSRFEGQGIAVLEAAACGAPVLVSGIPELSFVEEAGFGLSFRTGDPESLAEKITWLLKDESARERFSARAKTYASMFSWEEIARNYETYLERVLGNARAAN
jgi:glycosyltransferase involved in cell wall biosynthesis